MLLTSREYLREKESEYCHLNRVDECSGEDHCKVSVSEQGLFAQIWIHFSRTQLDCADDGDQNAQDKVDDHRPQHPSEPIDVGSNAH